MIRPTFINEQIYHIYNRGVDKRIIFNEERDYFRFINNLYEFNDNSLVNNVKYYYNKKSKSVQPVPADTWKGTRDLLVDILAFTLMPNHYHLLLRQRKDNGIVKFMHKMGTGYTNFFNKKYERTGSLFQGRFKAVHVDNEAHFIYLPHYIHTNPLSLNLGSSAPLNFLSEYRWSSFPDYIGNKNFPSVTHRKFLLDIYNGEDGYKKFTEERLTETSNGIMLSGIKDVAFD